MNFIVDIVTVSIIALVVVIIAIIVSLNRRTELRVKEVQKSRNLYRNQIDIAKRALQTEKELGSSGAELALMDIEKLQREYDDQKELTG